MCLLVPLMLICLIFGVVLSDMNAKAWTTYLSPNYTTVKTALYDYDELHYSKEGLDELAQKILDNDSANINTLIDYIKTGGGASGTGNTSGMPVKEEITLKYGKYNITSEDDMSDLYWMPVYMSTTVTNNGTVGDAVLTLYLAQTGGVESHGWQGSGEYGSFTPYTPVPGVSGSSYTDKRTHDTPSNMYGASYIRAATLGNGGSYVEYASDHGLGGNPKTIGMPDYSLNFKFMEFLQYTQNGSTTNGNLYEDIVTPSQLAWQANENFKDAVINGSSAVMIDGVDVKSTWSSYWFPNEAYDGPAASSNGEYNNSAYDYSKKNSNGAWKTDKVWLPSLSEVGTGMGPKDDGSTGDTRNGLWKLTANQRGNYYTEGAFGGDASPSWLRTANTAYTGEGGSDCCYSMFCIERDGSIKTHLLSERTLAIRPAIHLNLSAAIKKLDPPVDVPDKVTTTYIGELQVISHDRITLPEGTYDWLKKTDEQGNVISDITDRIFVEYFYDQDCKKDAVPINAGQYFMKITLNHSSLYFAKTPKDQRSKVVQFEIQKKKLGIKWIYEGIEPGSPGNLAKGVKYIDGTVIYDWDKKIGRSPELGILYSSAGGEGREFNDFDDLLKGEWVGIAYIIDEDKYNFNYELSYTVPGSDGTTSDPFAVGRKEVAMPYFLGHKGEKSVEIKYADEQYIQLVTENPKIANYLKITISSDPSGKEVKALGVSDEGYLTYKVSECAGYEFLIEFVYPGLFTWDDSGYSYTTNNNGITESNVDSDPRKLTLEVTNATIEVDFDGLPAEWSTITTSVSFTLNIRGIYNYDPINKPIGMRVYYMKVGDYRMNPVEQVDGVYTLSNIMAGEYVMYAVISDSYYGSHYHLSPSPKEQKFTVIQATSSLSDNDIKWQYWHDGQYWNDGNNGQPFGVAEHNTESKALEFNYDEEYYVFSLTLSDTVLHDLYYVKAVYSGDIFVKDAGVHCVTVTISAFYKNIQFTEKSYKFYFKINKITIDISALEWDYDGTPFSYDGKLKQVMLTPESLALIPGLTAQYVTDGNRRDADDYETTVIFAFSEEYATNYILPLAENSNTYDGDFSFTCKWKIAKAKLAVEWEVIESSTEGVVIVPVLKHGGEYVDYVYEHKEADGSWKTATSLTASGAAETYRVKAVIKEEYASNYELVNNEPREFQVPSGKSAVSVHFEHRGELVLDGAEFPYTGNAVELSLVVDGGGLDIKEYSFKYYSLSSSNARTELDKAPVDVGKYVAVVTAKYGKDTYLSDESTTEITFNIVKGEYDISQIYWIYEHGDTVIAATYDKDQQKWVDDQGREVIFSFEYDGTEHKLSVVCLQDFTDHEEDAVSVASLLGNTATNAGSDYTAYAEFDYNSDHYNDPSLSFPALSWNIRKAIINYNEVRWGYIDLNGTEKDFDSEDGASFMFTRVGDQVIGFTVAVIGLPKGVSDLIKYTTRDLTVATTSVETQGSTRYAVGEYITKFTISGTWTNPNYEDFNSADFSKTVPTILTWQIVRRNLSKLDYKDGFTEFDDRAHNVLELCNFPEDELDYFRLEITFVDSTERNVYNNYGGYDDIPYMLYHAGTYDIRLYELVGVNSTPVIWDFIRITVAKSTLQVEWNLDGSYPIGTVSGVYATDMITTKYYKKYYDSQSKKEKFAEVPLSYVRSTRGSEEFFAMVCPTEKYERDIDIKMNGDEMVSFTYDPFEPTPNAKALEFPQLAYYVNNELVDKGNELTIEYTGEEIVVTIINWNSNVYYSLYLYTDAAINNDGTFSQTEVGEYHIVLRFLKDADAYWVEKSEIFADEPNRDSHTLTLNIVPPTKWALEYPQFEEKSIQYTGDYVKFEITNWVALSKYLTYDVVYKGESLGKVLSFKSGGIYTVTFTFPVGSIGYWKDDPDDPKKAYVVQLTIFGDDNEPLEIIYPTLNRNTAEYTGSPLQFRLLDWVTYFSNFIEVETPDGVTFSGGIFTATTIGTFTIKVRIKDDSPYTFVDQKREYELSFSIVPGENTKIEVPITKPELDVTEQEYTGEELTFNVKNWTTIYSKYVEVTCSNSAVTIVGGTIKVTKAGTYTIVISFLDGALAYWDGTDKSRDPIKITIRVVDENDPNRPGPSELTKVGQPALEAESAEYNGKEHALVLLGITDMNAVTISWDEKLTLDESSSYSAKNVGTYTVTIKLNDPTKYCWNDGTTDDIVLTFTIVKGRLPEGTHVGVGNNGKPELQDENGNHVDSDFDFGDLFDVEFTDKDGNPVDPDDLVEGGEYNAKLVPHEDKIRESMEDADGIIDDAKQRNEDGGWDIVYEKDDEGGGFNPLWFLLGLGGIYAILLTIIIILAKRRQRLAAEEEDAEGGSDDYGDDDDDEYDYDDDED